ncbi:recQ4 helicase isoform X2 [Rhynchophorus ferrugineus]|uniref:recQ4 helicase isoform X2 n=1 Tax=Rhynchophorus ferrugineus TaxID=354439 RepID=UPI003FCC427B
MKQIVYVNQILGNMELLADPENKKTYDKCKYVVKVWEHKFIKRYNRVPSKLKTAALEQSFMGVEGFENVSESQEDDDIAELNIIKEFAENEKNNINILDKEDINVDNTEVCTKTQTDVWGIHLNKTTRDDENKPIQNEKVTSQPVQSITKKLFCGSKFNKRNPRKSLSFTQKKHSEGFMESPNFLSQPEPTIFHSFKSEEILTHSNIQMDTIQEKPKIEKINNLPPSIPINIFDRVLESKEKVISKRVDVDWLKRVENNIGAQSNFCNTELDNDSFKTKLDYDSDDIIENSDDELQQSKNVSVFHVAKKSRVCYDYSNGNVSTENVTLVMKPKQETSKNIEKSPENVTSLTHISNISENSTSSETVTTAKPLGVHKNSKAIRNKNLVINKREQNNTHRDSFSLRRSSRSNILKGSLEETLSGDEDPFYSDNNSDDPEFNPQRENKSEKCLNLVESCGSLNESVSSQPKVVKKTLREKRVKKVHKKAMGKKEQSAEALENESNANYELEFSIKRRIVKPRCSSIKKLIKEKLLSSKELSKTDNEGEFETIVKDKKQQAKDKLEQKVAAGTLNENFVTINLRKKVFVRGKKGKNFSKYKKALWKSKKKALYGPDMDMGGCDGGKLTCFNCGQEGHFARNCKSTKGDGLLPLEAQVEEECPFPTLEEASKLASESMLSIRKPKLAVNQKATQGSDENNPESITDNESEADESEDDEDDFFEDHIDSETLLTEMLKLEEYVKKVDIQEYVDNIKIVNPYFQLNDHNDIIDTPKEVFDALTLFGHSNFRGGQEKAIMRILSGKSTLVTLSTGSGKSLCYQLPAYLFSQREPCISLVISPLVSLMEDQVTGIPKFLKAACLHTNQTKIQRQKIMDALANGEVNVLLISPEAVVAGEKQTGFGSLLRKLPPIAFACIDEAHCVSQWSHNFRPSYLLISRVLRESLGVKTILGLTATATKATCESIINSLNIPDGLDGIISDVPLPDNLHLTASKDENRDRALINLLLSDKYKNCKSIIVYCTRRDECERIAGFLRTSLKYEAVVENTNKKRKRLNLQAEAYHAGLSASRRRTVQNAFMSGSLRVVVATVAFGMGINKSDIRAVIHFNMPNSFESYVQEVGRAGRDGLPAFCHVFLDSQGRDESELRRHIFANSIDRHVIRKLLQKIFLPCACKGICPKHEVAFSIEGTVRSLDIPEENISTLLCYLELHQNKYIELLNPAYTTCKVISYGGPLQIRKAAKDCPPLAMALALYKGKEGEDNILEFPVVEVASAMGWESGICKHKLKNLEWITVNNQQKRSSLSVQFTNLGFRLLAPGNLSDESLDDALDSLYNQVKEQEAKALKQLHIVHKTLLDVSEKNYNLCINQDESKENGPNPLKLKIRDYFNSLDPLADIGKEPPKEINEEQLVKDVISLISMYRDNQFTGRAVARIFQGIPSPNYPSVLWGRCKFWRSHMHEDFNEICKIATREIIRFR